MANYRVETLLDEIVEVVKSDKSTFRSKNDMAKVLEKVTDLTDNIRLATSDVDDHVNDTTATTLIDLEAVKQLVEKLDQFRGRTGMREEFKDDLNAILDELNTLLK